MSNVITLFKNNIRLTILKKKKFFLLMILLPIAFLLLYSKVLVGSNNSAINIGVVNLDNTVASSAVLNPLENESTFKIKNIALDTVTNQINNKNIDFAIIIPKGFENNLLDGKASGIKIESMDAEDTYKAAEPIVNAQINNLKYLAGVSNGNVENFNKAINNYMAKGVKLETKNLANLKGDYQATISFIGMLIYFIFMMSLFGTKTISEDRKNNVYARVFMAPIKAWQYYVANILTCLFTLAIQVGLALFALKYVTELNLGIGIGELALILMLVGLFAIVLELFVMAIMKDDTSMLGNIIVLVMAMLGGCFVPTDVFPSYMNKISELMPTRWALQYIADVQQGYSISEASKYIYYLIIVSVILLITVAFITSKEQKTFKEL